MSFVTGDPSVGGTAVGTGRGRATAFRVEGFALVNDTLMRGKSWEYNRRLYEAWAIYDHWPSTSLLQIGGPTDEGALVQAVWTHDGAEREYMTQVGAERFTEAVRVLTEELGAPPADILPLNMELYEVVFGPLARHFIDIGADLDESAGRSLGGQLTALDLDLSALDADQTEAFRRAAGLGGATVPEDLILRLSLNREGAIEETLLWPTEDLAKSFTEQVIVPAAHEATGHPDAVPVRRREIKRLAISSAATDLSALH